MYAFPLVIQDHHEGAEANRGCIELEGLGGRGSPSPKGPSPVRLLLGQYRGRRNAWKTAGRGVRGPPRRSAAAVTSICRRSAERPTQRRNRPRSGTVRVVCGRSLACRPSWTPRCWGSPCHCGSETCRRTCSCGPPYPACNVGAPEALPLDDFAQATAEPVPVRAPLPRLLQFGQCVQRHLAPDLDRRRVRSIYRDSNSFVVRMEDGERLRGRVVIAGAGIAPTGRQPRSRPNGCGSIRSTSVVPARAS